LAVIASKTKRLIVEDSKTVAELLLELDLTSDHIVLVDGKRMNPDDVIEENELVVVLPLIAGC
jgi:sulfur carrier protein ThiS